MFARSLRLAPLLCALALSLPSVAADAPANAGWVQLGDLRFELDRALALRTDGNHPGELGNVEIYFSRVRLDAAALHDSGYPEGAARDAVDAAGGGLAVLCISPQGEPCGVLLHHVDPPVHERLGEQGELRLSANEGRRIAGRWSLTDFDLYGTPVSADLRFDLPAPAKP
jgi:hypothetical protein